MTDPARRLSSWKEIAAYLGREVRTVMRWEKERSLPIHRGPTGKTGVVFADTDELDAWARGELRASEAALVTAGALALPVRPVRWFRIVSAAAVVAVAIGLVGWRMLAWTANEPSDTVVMTDDAVVARNADGTQKWRYDFGADRVGPMHRRAMKTVERLGGEGVVAGFSEATRVDGSGTRSGQLLWFDPAGRIKQSFSFEDRLAFGPRAYSAPWSISDYQVDRRGATRRIAVTAHHHVWWPSIVTVLDENWLRRGSFVHAGWIEYLRWLSADRLAVAGFSNLKDGGMVALLDAGALDGQSPSPEDGAFHCTGCGPDRPIRYVILPRSEVNRLSGAPFNRAALFPGTGMLTVYTLEVPPTLTGTPATALYEFTPQLQLIDASYSDRYWEVHQELERLGMITHTRQLCPERDGPPEIRVWEPGTGWTIVPTGPLRLRARSAIEQ